MRDVGNDDDRNPLLGIEMTQGQTRVGDLINQVRDGGSDTVYIGMYRAAARFAVRDDGALIYGFSGKYGPNRTVIQTRYEDVAGVHVPRELIYFCFSKAESREVAASHLYQLAAQVHSVCSLSANAGSTVIQETCFTEAPARGWKRFMRTHSAST